MTDTRPLQERLEEEKAQVEAIADLREQALASAEFRARVALHQGSTHENVRNWKAADKALKEYRAEQAAAGSSERFKNIEQAAAWIIGQGYIVSPRSVRNHVDRPGFPKRQKDGSYLQAEIASYAACTWENPGKPDIPSGNVDHGNRLKKALADEREIKVAQLKGSLLDADEEEARDTAILLGIRRHLENSAADRAKAIVSDISSSLTDDQRGQLSSRLPEIVANDLDYLAEIFDRLAQAGGVEVFE